MNEFCNCEQKEGEFQMTVSPSYMSYEAALVVEKSRLNRVIFMLTVSNYNWPLSNDGPGSDII